MGRVKDQLIDQQDQEYQESLEPDFDDYALATKDKALDINALLKLIDTFAAKKDINVLLYKKLIKIIEESDNKDDQREWDKVNDEGKFCKNCQHCERTRDAYGTGDSPCIRECTADDPSECPGLL
jgi:type I site-specific restriction-modification system R (restriction) subunit